MRRNLIWLIFMWFICSATLVQASQTIYRSFWEPLYHGQKLAYCLLGDHTCGKVVADSYCQKMGYKKSDHFIKAYNAGLTNYLSENARCQGWLCHSFKVIRCVGGISHHKPTGYMYRFKKFVLPRLNKYRVAWCNAVKGECGKIVARSFCKRMGYLREKTYMPQHYVLATRTLSEQKLCFGPQCDGFASIVCYR